MYCSGEILNPPLYVLSCCFNQLCTEARSSGSHTYYDDALLCCGVLSRLSHEAAKKGKIELVIYVIHDRQTRLPPEKNKNHTFMSYSSM